MKPDRLDHWIRWLMVAVVLAIAAFAFTESYTHIFYLAQAHHETGAALRMLPLSVDLVMVGAGLVMLHLRRKGLNHWLPRASLWGGAGVTLAANVGYGIFWGWLAAVISAWAPVALFVSVELAMLLVRSAHLKPEAEPVAGPSIEAMQRILANLPTEKTPRPFPPAEQAVTDSPGDPIQGWGQLGGQQAAGLQGIGLANGRK
jgi:uncharacterized protein DUF2637